MSISTTLCDGHQSKTNASATGNLHSINIACEGENDGCSDQLFMDKPIDGAVSACTAGDCDLGIDIQPAPIVDIQSTRQSLFFSQEASCIFDQAMEMHAAPTDDPPMWGDNFEDFREVADMLEDIDDFSTGHEAIGERDCDYPPNFKATAASNRGSLGCFFDDAGASSNHVSLGAKLESVNNEVTNRVSDGSNSAAFRDESDLPLHIMNMDGRIFEDNMLMGDIPQTECDSISDGFFNNRSIFDDAGPDIFNPKARPLDTVIADNLQESKTPFVRKDADLVLPASKRPTVLNSNVGPTDTAAIENNLQKSKAPFVRKDADLRLPASKPDIGPPDSFTHAYSSHQSKAPSGELPLSKESDLDLPEPEPRLHQKEAAFLIATPRVHQEARLLDLEQGTPSMPVNTSLSQLKTSPNPKDVLQSNSNCNSNNFKETAVAKNQAGTRTKEHHPKGTSKSDAAWQRRFLELEEFKRHHGHCNVHQKYKKNPSLGAWVARQRILMRHWEDQDEEKLHAQDNYGKSLQTAERVKRLKNVGLESSIGKGTFGKLCTRNTNEWEKQFSNLIKYRDTHGNCNVPTKSTSLGRWVSCQRKKYRKFLADEGNDQDKALGWSNELRTRFHRLKIIGFNFHVGKGNAQLRKST